MAVTGRLMLVPGLWAVRVIVLTVSRCFFSGDFGVGIKSPVGKLGRFGD